MFQIAHLVFEEIPIWNIEAVVFLLLAIYRLHPRQIYKITKLFLLLVFNNYFW